MSHDFPSAFGLVGTSSFTEFLNASGSESGVSRSEGAASGGPANLEAPHGTTIVALVCDSGVVMAGDRRATGGHQALYWSRGVRLYRIADDEAEDIPTTRCSPIESTEADLLGPSAGGGGGGGA